MLATAPDPSRGKVCWVLGASRLCGQWSHSWCAFACPNWSASAKQEVIP